MRQSEDTRKLSILCVEDDCEALEFLRSLLSLRFPDAELHTASDGDEGLKLFRDKRPGIILTDLSLPLLDGTALASRIREIEPKAKIVAISALSDADSRLLSEGQFDYYLLKPLDFKELARVIETLSRL